MSPVDQKDLSRRALQFWASNNSDSPEAVFAAGYVNHQEPDVEGGVTTKNLEAWKELVAGFHEAFSDSRVKVLMQIAEGDLVANRWAFTAVHTGSFMAAAPTGNEVTWTGVQIDRIENGKIVESWVDWDKYRFFQGIGLAD
jgi:predicted ester cyclase